MALHSTLLLSVLRRVLLKSSLVLRLLLLRLLVKYLVMELSQAIGLGAAWNATSTSIAYRSLSHIGSELLSRIGVWGTTLSDDVLLQTERLIGYELILPLHVNVASIGSPWDLVPCLHR